MSLANPHRTGRLRALTFVGVLLSPAPGLAASAVAPAAFDVADRKPLLVAHAEGAQVYACKPDVTGIKAWSLREPIATLIVYGQTIGRHYAGPTWALDDGGSIKAAPLASAPGATRGDVPLLKLAVTEHNGAGVLSGVKLVLRLNTRGGALGGACATAGELKAVPYSADYAFVP